MIDNIYDAQLVGANCVRREVFITTWSPWSKYVSFYIHRSLVWGSFHIDTSLLTHLVLLVVTNYVERDLFICLICKRALKERRIFCKRPIFSE